MSFVLVSLDEINDSLEEQIRHNAISTRMANLESEDFKKFVLEPDDKKTTPKKIDHEAQLKQFLQG